MLQGWYRDLSGCTEHDWITCKAFSVYGKDKFSVFDRDVSARTRDIPGELGVFVLLSKYFNGYDDQRMELALDCRAEELESLCREGSGKPDSVKASKKSSTSFLLKGSPPCRKLQLSIFPSLSNR